MLLDVPDVVGLTATGSEVGTLVAEAELHEVTVVGQLSPASGAYWIEPGALVVLIVVAQFTEAEVWVKSVAYGARVSVGLKPLYGATGGAPTVAALTPDAGSSDPTTATIEAASAIAATDATTDLAHRRTVSHQPWRSGHSPVPWRC